MSPLMLRPPVVVIGAGVAGLTVAHELAARGFSVTVVERATGRGADGRPGLVVGGMASSQYRSAGVFDPSRAMPDQQIILPGEHGFRFFPSYYHHIWDTMQRIPLYDTQGDLTHRRVYDNVMPCLSQGWTGGEQGPVVFSRRTSHDMPSLVWALRQALGLRLTVPDIETATMRFLRYLCTSVPRRATECEDMSAWTWFTGARTVDDCPRFQYSASFAANLNLMPVVLAAFDAEWGDARTNLDHLVQLTRPLLREQPKVDGVLNGPTTEAWFVPWRDHLSRLGVTFICAEALPLELVEGRVVCKITELNPSDGRPKEGPPTELSAEYYVIATDAPQAEKLSANLPAVGAARALRGFTTRVPPNPYTGADDGQVRDPNRSEQVGLQPWDRFQTLTGIQFFFDVDLQLLRGHLYFMGSEWSLTGITEQPFWNNRPDVQKQGYTSVLSVDIGDWKTGSPHVVPGRSMAAGDCTVDQLAKEVWRQITSSLAGSKLAEIPRPTWYVVDANIRYDEQTGLPACNDAPYFIPMVGDFRNRPGGHPWNPTCARPVLLEHAEEGVWQAAHGGQLVHWNQLLYAGTYLKTFTRLTSMEAACESGRHAVNAIIDHRIFVDSNETDRRAWPGVSWQSPPGFVDSQNGTPIAQPSAFGDYCVIWDIEDNEIPEFLAARDIDEALFRAGLPHPWDLLGLDRLTEITSWLNRLSPSAPPATPPDPAAALRAAALQGLRALADLSRLQNELLAKLLRPDGAAQK